MRGCWRWPQQQLLLPRVLLPVALPMALPVVLLQPWILSLSLLKLLPAKARVRRAGSWVANSAQGMAARARP